MNIKGILLRPLEDSDINLLHELLNDSDNQQLVGGSVVPMAKIQIQEWLQTKRSAIDICQFAIEVECEFCGYIQLSSINRVDGHATLGINILSRFRGKGLGRAAIQNIHKFAKRKLLLRKVVLYVRSDNDLAINLYSKIGYQKAGVLTQHVKTESGYVNLNIMEVIL